MCNKYIFVKVILYTNYDLYVYLNLMNT